MDIKYFQQAIAKHMIEVAIYLNMKLPIKAGAKVKSIVQENFRLGGFQNGSSITKWQETRRQQIGKGADAKRGPLLTQHKVLYQGTNYKPGCATVTIYNNVLYAAIHNEGGTTHPKVTHKMRRYAWARYYEAGGGNSKKKKRKGKGQESPEAQMWKGLALTKKQTLNIKIRCELLSFI